MSKPLVGKVTSWNDAKGFGFITPHGGGGRVFFHVTALADPAHRPQGQEVVSYELGQDDQGRPRAESVAYVGVETRVTSLGDVPVSVLVGLAGFAGVLVVTFGVRARLLMAIGFYLVVSLITYAAYHVDKARAKDDEWRISESTLHVMALVGGWPGALIAQHRLRHKVRKPDFMAMFWFNVVLNLIVVILLNSSVGTNLFK